MPFDPVHSAEVCRRAMKGWGCDDDILIETVCNRTTEELQVLRETYTKELKRDLIQDVKDNTSWWYKEAMVATLMTPEQYTCRVLRKAMAGLGTDERAMIQVLTHLKKPEMEAVKATYLAMYKKTLAYDIEDDTSGSLKKFFIGLLDSPRDRVENPEAELERDVVELYNAGQARYGHDDNVFIRIITKHDNEYLRALNIAYGRKYGDTLVRCVQKQFSGYLGEGMQAMLMDHDAYYATLIFKAVDGMGTDDATLVRVLACRRHRMHSIALRFMLAFGKNLQHRVAQDVSGKYAKVLDKLIEVSERASANVRPSAATAAAAAGQPLPEQPMDTLPPTSAPPAAPTALPGSSYPVPLPGVASASPAYPPQQGAGQCAPANPHPAPQYPPPTTNPGFSAHPPSSRQAAYPPPAASGAYPPPAASAAYPPLAASAAYPPPAASAAYPPPAASAAYPPPAASVAYPPPAASAAYPQPAASAAYPPPTSFGYPASAPPAHYPPRSTAFPYPPPTPAAAAPPLGPMFGSGPPPGAGGNVAMLIGNLEAMGFQRADIDNAIAVVGGPQRVESQPLPETTQAALDVILSKQQQATNNPPVPSYAQLYPSVPGGPPPPPPPFFGPP